MRFKDHVKWRNEKFGAVIFDTLNEKVYVTNSTGRDIVCFIGEGTELGTIEERLKKEFDGDAAQIASEARVFAGVLQSAGLLAPEEGGAP